VRKKLLKITLALTAIFLLRTGIVLLRGESSFIQQVEKRGLDPSIMFYTESEEVLAAEKIVKRRIRK